MRNLMKRSIKTKILLASMVFTLAACVDTSIRQPNSSVYHTSLSLIEEGNKKPDSLSQKALELMAEGKLSEATDAFSNALRLNFNNSSLQLLNGINYHLRAVSGDSNLFKMAEQAYLASVRFDRSNWNSRFYLGLLYLDTRRFEEAKIQFGTYVLNDDKDPEGLYYLAASSYKAGDSITAHSAATRLWELTETLEEINIDPRALLRLMSITTAAVNLPEKSNSFVDQYLLESNDVNRTDRLRRRIEDWNHFYKKADVVKKIADSEITDEDAMNDDGFMETASVSDEENTDSYDNSDQYGSNDDQDYDSSADEGDFVENQMVAVDVVIIRTEEDVSTSRGINVLEGLQLQFGDPLNSINAFLRTRSKTSDFNENDPTLSGEALNTRSLVSTISIPAVSYTLNIANDQNGKNEIIARPTLVARAGQTSEFFSGVEVLGAAVSGGAGDSVSIEREIGVRLAVTPEFGPDGTIILHVTAERTFLTQPSRSVEFEFRLDTSKTTVDANVAMRYGQTLILSGLTERDIENGSSGVPGLKDIPGVNLLFSRRTSRNFNKSVIILLTPHPTQYLYNSELSKLSKNGKRVVGNGIQDVLADRYETWFQPIPTTKRVLDDLKRGDIYRYFQSGDVKLDAWYESGSHKHRLQDQVEASYMKISSVR